MVSQRNCWIFFSFVVAAPFIYPANAKTIFISPIQRNEATFAISTSTAPPTTIATLQNQDIILGPCIWAIGRTCPDKDVAFHLYTRQNPKHAQLIHIDGSSQTSNLSQSFYDHRHPSKIIIHGYNANMFLHSLALMKNEYLAKGDYNVFYVEWSTLALGPCYLNAVHNIQHTGACVAQLVERIRDTNSSNIHVIGFSLGAHVANYVSRNLEDFILPRITGLDPALPLFITSDNNEKLDKSDAAYVDVIHTNALIQGKFERCGHADFYMNGGVFQPNCFEDNPLNPFPCFHHRALDYYLESIRSTTGFWAWPCSSYFAYLLGRCPPTNNMVEVGENVVTTTVGMFFVDTKGESPYAMGKWTNSTTKHPSKNSNISAESFIPMTQQTTPSKIDQWDKLNYNFNNRYKHEPTPYSQDPYGDNWTYFSEDATEIVPELVEKNEPQLSNSVWQEFKRNATKGFIATSILSTRTSAVSVKSV